MTEPQERTWLLAGLGAALAIVVAILVWHRGQLLVAWWVIAAIAVPWLASGVLLRIKQATLGFEGKYVDWWSVPHFGTGVLFALCGVGIALVAAIAVAWELIEIGSRTREYPTNRAIDVVLATAGWATANALAGGGFPLL